MPPISRWDWHANRFTWMPPRIRHWSAVSPRNWVRPPTIPERVGTRPWPRFPAPTPAPSPMCLQPRTSTRIGRWVLAPDRQLARREPRPEAAFGRIPQYPPIKSASCWMRLSTARVCEHHARNLVAVLIDHRRVQFLGRIVEQLKKELDARMGFAEADITSAANWATRRKRALEAQIEKVTGRKYTRSLASMRPVRRRGSPRRQHDLRRLGEGPVGKDQRSD